jgi:hypothetical protein
MCEIDCYHLTGKIKSQSILLYFLLWLYARHLTSFLCNKFFNVRLLLL